MILPSLAKTLESATDARRHLAPEIHRLVRGRVGLAYLHRERRLPKDRPCRLDGCGYAPFPAYDLLPSIAPYHTGVFQDHFAMIQTSRGCPFGCSFCAYALEKYRPRPHKQVTEELKWLRDNFGAKNVLFFDDILALNSDRTADLANQMIQG